MLIEIFLYDNRILRDDIACVIFTQEKANFAVYGLQIIFLCHFIAGFVEWYAVRPWECMTLILYSKEGMLLINVNNPHRDTKFVVVYAKLLVELFKGRKYFLARFMG